MQFHHAHETYLVPDLLKQAWPGNGTATPAVALFATNGRYKREAWRGSEYAAKILNEQNISVLFKSDHPVTDSRYLLYQAQQGHDFGLPANKALASITTVPAVTAGLSHRIGFLRRNYDADVVLWSSHPLSLGATPQQVWIDGVAQLAESFPPASPGEDETARRNGPPQASLRENYDPTREQEDDGFDWLNPGETEHRKKPELVERVKFTNVGEVLLKDGKQSGLASLAQAEGVRAPFEVVVDDGKIVCLSESCGTALGVKTVDLKNGSLLPSLVTFGSALGLTDIIAVRRSFSRPPFALLRRLLPAARRKSRRPTRLRSTPSSTASSRSRSSSTALAYRCAHSTGSASAASSSRRPRRTGSARRSRPRSARASCASSHGPPSRMKSSADSRIDDAAAA